MIYIKRYKNSNPFTQSVKGYTEFLEDELSKTLKLLEECSVLIRLNTQDEINKYKEIRDFLKQKNK